MTDNTPADGSVTALAALKAEYRTAWARADKSAFSGTLRAKRASDTLVATLTASLAAETARREVAEAALSEVDNAYLLATSAKDFQNRADFILRNTGVNRPKATPPPDSEGV